jgi:hypothetical protein
MTNRQRRLPDRLSLHHQYRQRLLCHQLWLILNHLGWQRQS